MKRLLHTLLWTLALLSAAPYALAQEEGWPRTLAVDEGFVTIYPLQVEGRNDDVVSYRAALAYRANAAAEPVFGAGWLESRVQIDHDAGVVHPLNLVLTKTRFPDGTDDVESRLARALAVQALHWNLDYPLSGLDQALAAAEAETRSLQALNTAPPRIIYRDHPALLVTLDGQPVLRAIENSPYQAVINTPYPLIFDGKSYYLNVAPDVWYRAYQATGPYTFENQPPATIAAMVKPDEEETAAETPAEPITAANAPEIVVSTEPAELIVTEGPAAFVPLVDDLLVLQNSDDDVFMHVGTQQYYVVLAGRWYHAKSLNGPWEYQAADRLPPAFADIPDSSAQADARVYVAGTPEAEDAVLDAQVPQTAVVARGTADVDVDYDGDPDFQPVDGTDMQYAANTGATVLHSGRTYFLVDDGVWYISASPNGPWRVADYRPAEVVAIAPTSPVYNVKYVYVYDSTPDVVYVGYTPGYLGSYVYYDTVVYGTGWYYRPWLTPRYYYPRFSTWGFHVAYNPWSGWSFGLSWNWGPFYTTSYYTSWYSGGYWHDHHYWHHRHYGYWGPRGYRHRPAHYDRRAYAHDGHGRPGRDYRGHDGHRYDRGRNDNLYRDRDQRARVAWTRDNRARKAGPDDRGYDRRRKPGQYTGKESVADRGRNVTPQKTRRAGKYGQAGPVSAADLRRKAEVRKINRSADGDLLVADNAGKVRRQNDRRTGPGADTTVRQVSKQARMRKQPGERPDQRQSGYSVNELRQKTAAAQRKTWRVHEQPRRQSQDALTTARPPDRNNRRQVPKPAGKVESPPARNIPRQQAYRETYGGAYRRIPKASPKTYAPPRTPSAPARESWQPDASPAPAPRARVERPVPKSSRQAPMKGRTDRGPSRGKPARENYQKTRRH
ncbi:MAG: hypothetical protein PVJ33_04210 [Lysobacterales bacterium]|jgi:hypothetical protein